MCSSEWAGCMLMTQWNDKLSQVEEWRLFIIWESRAHVLKFKNEVETCTNSRKMIINWIQKATEFFWNEITSTNLFYKTVLFHNKTKLFFIYAYTCVCVCKQM